MLNQNTKLNRFFLVLDIFVIIISYVFSWLIVIYLRENTNVGVLSENIYFSALLFLIPLFLLLYGLFDLYKPIRTTTIISEFSKIIEVNILVFLFINIIFFVFAKNTIITNFSRLLIIVFIILNTFIEFFLRNIVRVLLKNIRKKGINQKHILLVGYSDASFKFIDRVYRNPGWGYKVFGIIDDKYKLGTEYRNIKVISKIDGLKNVIEENSFDEIAITLCLEDYDKLKDVVTICERSGVHTKFVPDYGTIIPTSPVSEDLDGLPVINIRAVPLQKIANRFLKRTFDIIGSIIGLIIFFPFMLIIIIAIRIDSKGKVIFSQKRVGRHNKIFNMYKFRSMTEQKDEDDDKWTSKNSKRITKVGKIIRKISFDEIPQFYNVLIGDMSLIGPRPERVEFVEKFKETIPRYMIKHQVRPGMTGYAQINGLRGDTSIDQRIQYDLWYIENWSILLDIKIILLTFVKGFINKNAY